jgi:uncharacterized membrane protein YkoI
MKINTIVCSLIALGLVGLLASCETERGEGKESEAKLQAEAKISRADAERIAMAKVPGGSIKEGGLEKEKGKLIWSFDIATSGSKDITEVAIDALTREVVSVAKETPAQQQKESEAGAKDLKFTHPRDITNPWLPLASLKQDVLEGREGSKMLRIERTARPEVHKSFKLGGRTVEALAVEDREFENGKLSEVTLDYFAQSDDGTVYYLGEDVDEYKNDKITGHSGAWLYGVHTKVPGVLMPAHPKVGDKFKSEDVPRITTEDDEVLSLSESVKVPAGTYDNCLKIKEKLSDGATEYKCYAKGVGCVRELPERGDVLLISHTTK